MPQLIGTFQILLDAKALGLSTPNAGIQFRCVLRGTVHFFADFIDAVLGFTPKLNGEVSWNPLEISVRIFEQS